MHYSTFAVVATVIGFVVDTIAILGILQVLRLGENLTLSLNPLMALFIWAIAVFGYVSGLQAYWSKHNTTGKFTGSFVSFVTFYLPSHQLILLLPIVIAFMLLLWIWGVLGVWIFQANPSDNGWELLYVIVTSAALFLTAVFGGAFLSELPASIRKDRFAAQIEQDWGKWDRLVTARLEGYQWIGETSFEDVKTVEGVGDYEIRLLLARYAGKHPKKSKFARVIDRASNKYHTDDEVLVSLSALDAKRYSC